MDDEDPVSLYETDFYSWAMSQARMIRSGQIDPAELEHIAEEIETLGRSEARSLESAYRVIAMHILKTIHHPHMAPRVVNRRSFGSG